MKETTRLQITPLKLYASEDEPQDDVLEFKENDSCWAFEVIEKDTGNGVGKLFLERSEQPDDYVLSYFFDEPSTELEYDLESIEAMLSEIARNGTIEAVCHRHHAHQQKMLEKMNFVCQTPDDSQQSLTYIRQEDASQA